MPTLNQNPWLRGLTRAVPLSALVMLASGWTNALPHLQPGTPEAKTVEAGSLRLGQSLRGSGALKQRAVTLDLSDDGQYQFLLTRLRAAGKTPQKAPYLHERLSAVRARQQERARTAGATAARADAAPAWCDHDIFFNDEVPDLKQRKIHYETNVLVTCRGGANYVFADLNAYETDVKGSYNKLIDSSSGEEYSDGRYFTQVRLNSTVDVGTVLRMDSTMIASDVFTGEEQVTFYELSASALSVAPGLTLTHPSQRTGGSASPIWMCQLRGGADCDYSIAGQT
ncbi:hypothetical protein D7V93_13195, partial [Corallococcus llansteffanensis]